MFSFQPIWTSPSDSLAWMRVDGPLRLLPFALLTCGIAAAFHPSWLGFGPGDLPVQLAFAAAGAPLGFVAAMLTQLLLSRRRGSLRVPTGGGDAALQAAYYALNGPLEEALFRGLVQGGLGVLWTPPLGFVIGTTAYVLYHRLAGWSWLDTLATALVGIPLGLAFWLLPGPASLIGVSVVHAAATSGFLGPGPYLLAQISRRRAAQTSRPPRTAR